MSIFSLRRFVGVLLLAGIVLRLVIIFLPHEELLGRWGSDDLFYYSQIAGHIAHGDGATFDGLNPTNGFQPLFMGVLIPFGKLFLNDSEASLRIVLLLASVLTFITVFQVIALFSFWGLKELGLIFGALLFIHPKILSVTFNGTEAALTLLMVVLALRAVQKIEQNKNLLWSALVFTGLVLTRLDMSFILAGLSALLLWKGVSFRRVLLVNVLPGVVLICWLWINWYFMGNLLPDSGVAKSLHGSLIQEMSSSGSLVQFFSNLKGAVHTLLMAESKLSLLTLLFVGIGLLRLIFFEHFTRKGFLPYLLVITISGIAIVAAAIIKLNSFRDWYLMPLFLVTIWLMSLGLDTVRRQLKNGNWVLVIVPLLIWGEAQWQPRSHMAPHYLEAAKYIEENIPRGSRIGAFNAGLYGAQLGSHFMVINLDGVVNHNVIESLKDKDLSAYIEANNIEWLIDHSGSVNFFSNFSKMNLTVHFNKIHELKFEGETSDITIYKRKPGFYISE